MCNICGKSFTRSKPFTENQKILCHGCGIKQYYIDHSEAKERVKYKIKSTFLTKYGVSNISQCKTIKEKVHNTYKNKTEEEKKSILEKRKATNIKKYGVEHVLQNKEINARTVETQRANHGGKCG